MQRIIPGSETTIIPQEYEKHLIEADLIIEIGSNYVDNEGYLEDPFFYLPDPYAKPEEDEEDETE